ncbi:MAG: DEAD/DEAH box helicase family protein, partial [Chlamydiales bacterium]|nr:DEAD/DEAH box helicase family protein [Chlamydiales bacterium]
LLEQLNQYMKGIQEKKGRQARQLLAEISLIALDIAAVCAEHIPALKFGDKYTVTLNVLVGHEAAFSDPDSLRTLERVKKNFSRRAIGKTPLFSAKIDMEKGAEVCYLLDHVITRAELERFLPNNPKQSISTVVQTYFVNCGFYKETNLPGEEFGKPCKALLSLINWFVFTSQYNQSRYSQGYLDNGVLAILPSSLHTFTGTRNRKLGSEFFQARIRSSDTLIDDRQNLVYSLAEAQYDDLAKTKVGVIYDTFRQYEEEKPFRPEVHRELCTLEASRELRCLNALDWMMRPHQFQHVEDSTVRDRLETLLFGPESALHVVRHFPTQLVDALVRFQKLYQKEASIEALEWCSSVVDRFRYHLEVENKVPERLVAVQTRGFLLAYLQQHRANLSVQSQGALHRALALSHLHHVVPNPEEFVFDLIRAAYHGVVLTGPTWPLLLGLSCRLKVDPATICKNPRMFTQLAQEILQTSDSFEWAVDPKSTSVVVGTSKGQKCTFNLYTGESSTPGGRIIDLLDELKQNKAFCHLAVGRNSLPVVIQANNYALSVDGTLGFRLDKQNDVYVIINAYKDLKIAVGDNEYVRSARLEANSEESQHGLKVFSLHTPFVLQELLGSQEVHTWNLDVFGHARFERLHIEAQNPQNAVVQTEDSYECMQLEDGVWRSKGVGISFITETGLAYLDDLIRRAVPLTTSDGNKVPGCGFLYEKGAKKKMVIPSLHISFTRCFDRNIWVYDQDKDYKLMSQKSVSALDGYEHGFVLQHIRDSKIQRVLLTPFAWKEQENLSVPDFTNLLQDRPFILDFVGDEIVCDETTHLYLSFIFRNTRRFDLAIRELENSRHLGVDSALQQQMVKEIAKFRIVTTPGIAFDIHFLARALEHAERFTEKTFSKHPDEKTIETLLRDLVSRYSIATSHYREGVSGIPESLAVPEWILKRFASGVRRENRLTSVRLSEVERATYLTSKNYLLEKKETRSWYLEISSIIAKQAKEKNNSVVRALRVSDPQKNIQSEEIVCDFLELAKWATSKSAFEVGKVKSYILTYISQHQIANCYNRLLLQLLLIMLKYPEEMQGAASADTVLACVEAGLAKLQSLEIKEPCTLFSPFLKRTKLAKPVAKPPLLAPTSGFVWKTPTVEYDPWPTRDLYGDNFTEFTHKPYKKALWPVAQWKSTDKLEMGLIQSLNQAFEDLKETQKSLHEPNEKIILELDERQRSVQAKRKAKQTEIERLLNQAPEACQLQFVVLQAAQVIGKLTVAHAIQALLQRSDKPILKSNPTLTEDELDTIYTRTIEYQLLCIEDKQIDEIRRVKNDSYRLAEVLFRKRCYDPAANPEILAYAAATGKDPTSQQAAVLEQIFKALSGAIDQKKIKHLLLEFAAGGGKTMLLTPIITMFLLSRGKLPVICTTPELYYQSLESLPPMLKAAYNMQMELIDRDVEHQWSVDELKGLLAKLERWHTHQGRPVLMKGSSWHSLNTAGKIAGYLSVIKRDKEAETIRGLIGQILTYFKEHGVRLEDECQEGSDPHELTVRSFEEGAPVPMSHHDIYYKAYQIANKHQTSGSTITPEIAARIKAECIEFFVQYKPFANFSWFKKYLSTDLHAARPLELISLNQNYPAIADLCILAKACIGLHLPHTESLTLGKEFGASIHEGDMTAAPRHDGRPTSAHFTDNMLVTALTVQKALEVGVPQEHLDAIAKGLRDEHETALFKHERLTAIEESIRKLANTPDFRMKNYTDNELVALLAGQVKESWLIDRYLTRHALVQNRLRGRSCQSTPAEMALGFNISIQMSAFVGLRQLYSVLLGNKDELLDTSFVAEVLAVLFERATEGHIIDDRSSPQAFFKELFEKSPLDADFMEAYFDKGGLFANLSAQDQLQGALDATGVNRPGITWDKERTIHIPPAKLSQKIGFNLAAFPLRQTTGRDYPELGFNARCAFLLGKKVTLSGVVQTAMRARKLLIPRAQTVFWAVMRDLWSTIAPGVKHFEVEKALRWSLHNFAEELKSKVLARAYQGIDA